MKTSAVIASLAATGFGKAQDGGIASSNTNMMSYAMELKMEAFQRYADEGLLAIGDSLATVNRHIPCEGGEVYIEEEGHGVYECRNTDFYSFTNHRNLGSTFGFAFPDPEGGPQGSDIWGYTAPNGEELLAVGHQDGTGFARINADGSVSYLGRLPTATVPSPWRDVKTYGSFVAVGSEAEGHGIQFFDLDKLQGLEPVEDLENDRIFEADSWFQGVGSSHNVVIDEESGFLYAVGSDQFGQGLYAVDIRDPLNPTFAGDFSIDGYTHDAQCIVYDGPDERYTGREVCVAFNEDTVTFVDVTNKDRMRQISRVSYKGYSYTHQGWWSTDRRSLFIDDELDEVDLATPNNLAATRTIIFNTEDLENPFYISDFISSQTSVDHNLYTRQVVSASGRVSEYVLESNYTAGLRILQIRRGGFGLRERGFFDVHPEPTGAEFLGAWSVYPYFASGYMAVNTIERGLFIVRPSQFVPPPADGSIASDETLAALETLETEIDDIESETFELTDSAGQTIEFANEEDFLAKVAELAATAAEEGDAEE